RTETVHVASNDHTPSLPDGTGAGTCDTSTKFKDLPRSPSIASAASRRAAFASARDEANDWTEKGTEADRRISTDTAGRGEGTINPDLIADFIFAAGSGGTTRNDCSRTAWRGASRETS